MTAKRFLIHFGSPLVVCIGFLVGLWSINSSETPLRNGYDAIVSTWAIFYGLAPALALASAWEMSRFKNILLSQGKQANIWKIFARRIGPLIILAFLLSFIPLVIYGGATNDQTLHGTLLLAVPLLLWGLFGSICGLWLPALLALAVSAIFPVVATLYPASFTDIRWRQMFGQAFGGCCSTHQRIDPILLNASTLTLSALTVAFLILVACRIANKRTILVGVATALIIAAGGLALGYSLSANGNANSAVARNMHQLSCSDVACVWPETDLQAVALNRQELDRLGLSHMRIVDLPRSRDPYGNANIRLLESNELSLVHHAQQTEVALNLTQQMLAKDTTLMSMPSCWLDENDEPWPVSEIIFDLPAEVIQAAALREDGAFRGLAPAPEGFDRSIILRAVTESCQP